MSCDDARPDLGAWLTGGLDPEKAELLSEHVEQCAACGAELAALQELTEALGQPRLAARSTRRRRWTLAAAAALLLALGLGVGAQLGADRPEVRVVWGDLFDPQGKAGLGPGGAPPPQARPLTARRGALLAFPCGSAAECEPGSRFTIKGPRALSLVAGSLELRVAKADEPFVVATPRGDARVVGTSFRMTVTTAEDEAMKKTPSGQGRVEQGPSGQRKGFLTGLSVGAGTMVVVAVTAGAVLFEPSGGKPAVRVEAGQQVVATADGARVSSLGAATTDGAATEAPGLRTENEQLRAKAAALETRGRELEAELAQAKETLAALKTGEAGPAAAPTAKVGAPVRYGRWNEVEGLSELDWKSAAEAANDMRKKLPELHRLLAAGTPMDELPGELMIEITKSNQKLISLALDATGKLPTNGAQTVNGVYTHPFMLLNLMARSLDAAGLPLDEGQTRALERIGQVYDQAYDQRQAGYGPQTLALEKVLDELTLKRETSDAADAVLSPAQRDAVCDPRTRHHNQIDIYSPTLMLAGIASPLGAASEAEVPDRLAGVGKRWGLTLDPAADDVLRRWAAEALAGRPRVSEVDSTMFTLDAALQSGAAQVAAMKTLLARPDTPAAVRTKLLEDQLLVVPSLLTPP